MTRRRRWRVDCWGTEQRAQVLVDASVGSRDAMQLAANAFARQLADNRRAVAVMVTDDRGTLWAPQVGVAVLLDKRFRVHSPELVEE